MLRFETGKELISILENLSEDLYYKKIKYVEENYHKAMQLNKVDDRLFDIMDKTMNLT